MKFISDTLSLSTTQSVTPTEAPTSSLPSFGQALSRATLFMELCLVDPRSEPLNEPCGGLGVFSLRTECAVKQYLVRFRILNDGSMQILWTN